MNTLKYNKYAPIVIPTLNRFEHLKKCLESLEHCTGAEKTDVYISLDYPPSNKYVEGWRKIDIYLKEKEKKNSFSKLIVIRREQNYGACGKNSNMVVTLKEISKFSDRYIFTEDDNIFSPNFLEYINWGLNKFKDDQRIFAICGFKNVDTSDFKNNVYMSNSVFSAWGYGTWVDRRKKLDLFNDFSIIKKEIDKYTLCDIFSKKITKVYSLLYQYTNKQLFDDFLVSLIPEKERWCVFPRENMVRNYGWDGTGTHGGSAEAFMKYSQMSIDEKSSFEPIIVEDLYNPLFASRFKKVYHKSYKSRLKAALIYIVYRITGCLMVRNRKSGWPVKLLKVF